MGKFRAVFVFGFWVLPSSSVETHVIEKVWFDKIKSFMRKIIAGGCSNS